MQQLPGGSDCYYFLYVRVLNTRSLDYLKSIYSSCELVSPKPNLDSESDYTHFFDGDCKIGRNSGQIAKIEITSDDMAENIMQTFLCGSIQVNEPRLVVFLLADSDSELFAIPDYVRILIKKLKLTICIKFKLLPLIAEPE